MGRIHDIWRQAALDGTVQFRGRLASTRGTEEVWEEVAQCAVTVLPSPVSSQLGKLSDGKTKYLCPVEACDYVTTPEKPQTFTAWMLAVHLNNHHQWDWLDLANKYPEIGI